MQQDVNKVKNYKTKKKMAAITGLGAFVFALIAVSPTAANWVDDEAVGTDVNSGSFNLEISTNGGSTWQSNNSSAATLAMDSFDYWAPGDSDTAEFLLRVSPDSSHSGSLDFSCDGSVVMTSSGTATNGYDWTMGGDGNAEYTPFTAIGGPTLTECNDNDFDDPTEITMNPGEAYQFNVLLSANPSLQQDTSASVEWEFTAESIPNS